MKNNKIKHHKKIITIQVAFIILILIAIYFLYPKVKVDTNGTLVKFGTINANVVMLSKNPDFSNPRYLDFQEKEDITFDLQPGKYYWKPSNNLISGLTKELTIDSKVGMEINNSNLKNTGNVKINITENNRGVLVGHIILEPNQEEKIENQGEYIGGQEQWKTKYKVGFSQAKIPNNSKGF